MNVRYRITLTSEEREMLRSMVQAGKGRFRRLKRAQILLAASSGSSDVALARNLSVGASTVYRTKRRFMEEGLDAALSEEPRPGADRKLAAKEEALLIATACAAPPTGRARWDARAARWRDGAPDKSRFAVDGDDSSPARRKSAETLA